ncbi:ATP-grasp ribosomal peptide maturase [Protofrankia symbiont of Coriaria ruscifolia]|uniref:ATP-grasp ribosomal peptide maturase n=1 Tax=Protofrankia symbiont of Coriaria ruscifolia TaxID=1306542 RepID=UPI00104112E1
MHVLVVTAPNDATADLVVDALEKRSVAVFRFDIAEFPQSLEIGVSLEERWRGYLQRGAHAVDLGQVGGIYYRRPGPFALPETLTAAERRFAAAEARYGFGGVLISLPGPWVNHPSRISLAEYKPLQLQTAARSGLRTPRTLISNSAVHTAKFAASLDGPMVYKPLSTGVVAEDGQVRLIYTTVVDSAALDAGPVASTAHLFQEWIPKAHDVRLTAVGNRCFSVAIHADSSAAHTDWRADYDSLTYQAIDTPTDVEGGVRRYLDQFGLLFGAFDFTVSPTGDWYFLECNPNGQWDWLAEITGLPVAGAIADALTGQGHNR